MGIKMKEKDLCKFKIQLVLKFKSVSSYLSIYATFIFIDKYHCLINIYCQLFTVYVSAEKAIPVFSSYLCNVNFETIAQNTFLL